MCLMVSRDIEMVFSVNKSWQEIILFLNEPAYSNQNSFSLFISKLRMENEFSGERTLSYFFEVIDISVNLFTLGISMMFNGSKSYLLILMI